MNVHASADMFISCDLPRKLYLNLSVAHHDRGFSPILDHHWNYIFSIELGINH